MQETREGHKLAFSGWMASGKDTLAAAVMSEICEAPAVRLSYADPIREEVDRVCAAILEGADADSLASAMRCSRQQAKHILDLLTLGVRSGRIQGARTRTESMRAALQYWGTDVRRSQDQGYWIKESLRSARALTERGIDVYYTDLRFPNEVQALQEEGFYTVRIQVSREVQAQRLEARDSISISDLNVTLTHPSETALDDHEGFDLFVDNDGPLTLSVSRVVAGYRDSRDLA